MRAALAFVAIVWGLAAVPPGGASGLRLEGFAMDLAQGGDDDAVLLRNLGGEAADLSNVSVSDNAGSWRLPAGAVLGPGDHAYLTQADGAFVEAFGRPPDFSQSAESASRRILVAGSFGLSQSSDRIVLWDGGTILDAVAYGDGEAPPGGWEGPAVPIAGGTFLRWFARAAADDTDTAADWDAGRRAYAGEHLWPPGRASTTGILIAYAAPEHSRAVLRSVLLSAESSIRANVYQFRDLLLADELAAHVAARPGLRLDLLLDEQPVGESREELSERGHVIDRLVAAGATVRLLEHDRYRFDHAKYVVVDEELLLVQTENFVPSGIPADGESGNRGWGLVVEDPVLASAAAEVFDADFELRPFGARGAGLAEAPTLPPPELFSAAPARGRAAPRTVSGPANATLLVAPLASGGADDPVRDLIGAARTEILVAQLDLAPWWRAASGAVVPHPYLAALYDAAGRGVRVRVLLDGHFLEDAGALGSNADTVAVVEARAAAGDIEARLQDGDAPVLHAKGMVVDRATAMVGSMNWNANSVLQNREVGLVVERAEVASFFADLFETDWEAAGPGLLPTAPFATVLTAVCLGFAIEGLRRR